MQLKAAHSFSVLVGLGDLTEVDVGYLQKEFLQIHTPMQWVTSHPNNPSLFRRNVFEM